MDICIPRLHICRIQTWPTLNSSGFRNVKNLYFLKESDTTHVSSPYTFCTEMSTLSEPSPSIRYVSKPEFFSTSGSPHLIRTLENPQEKK